MVISPLRARHWAIIKSTAVLPKALRVRARVAMLGRLQRQMLASCDVLFIRHPKTGGTWLRALLTHLYASRNGVSLQRVFKADELKRQDATLPQFLITHGRASWERVIAEAFEAADPVLDGKKVLFLARDPGDIAVSWHRQYRKRTKAFKRELLEAEFGLDFDPRTLARWEFIQQPDLGLPALIDYHNFWARQLAGRHNALIIRYEDLRGDTPRTLREVVDFLGEDFSDEQIAAAVEFGSVENMSRLEHSGYFQNSSLRLRDGSDPDTFKVRRAKVGGFRDDLTPEQAEWVASQVREHCDPRLGYSAA
ncbi:MAG: sulfotransferase domain-containing protein [Gammaproteobacteria bacterium]|nr:sulfotransferase domain-containing protein [Gammaproteobacteria bacterium]